MLWLRPMAPAGLVALAALGAFVALGSATAGAQTSPTPAAGAAATSADQNCAVSTARIGGLDLTEFFGVRGGASGFAQNFGAAPSQSATTQPQATLAQRCIRLEIENPAPGDLVPAGGYVMGGFAFDPAASPNQGSGIVGLQVFLDDPNQGGAIVGQATPDATAGGGRSLGLASARAAAFGDQFGNAGFVLTLQIPGSAAGGQHALFVVAQASTGRIGTVAVPVSVGNLTPASPTRTP